MTNERNTASKHKDIARIDQKLKRTYGWYVRVRFNGKIHSKFFSDKKGRREELSAVGAISWRNNTRSEIGKPQTDRHIVTVASNLTGVVGVRLAAINEIRRRSSVLTAASSWTGLK